MQCQFCYSEPNSKFNHETTLHPDTNKLIGDFADALRYKLLDAQKKYGYSNGWARTDWMDECRAKLREHVEKGDPRDVAAYCAFLWYHGESTAPSQPAAPVVADGEVKRLRAVIERDRCTFADCVTKMKKALQACWWIVDSRGPYEWDDKRYQDEFGEALRGIDAELEKIANRARDMTDSPSTEAELREARSPHPAQPQPSAQQEPIAWMMEDCGRFNICLLEPENRHLVNAFPVYRAPPAQEPKFPLSFQCPRCGEVPAGDCIIAVGTSAASTDDAVRAKLIELGWRAPTAEQEPTAADWNAYRGQAILEVYNAKGFVNPDDKEWIEQRARGIARERKA